MSYYSNENFERNGEMEIEESLSELLEGEVCRVKAVCLEGNMKKRLADLGVIEGTKIECLHTSMFDDPTAYLIRGAVIAIRKSDSKKIIVEKVKTV